jgi:hypothetical protein
MKDRALITKQKLTVLCFVRLAVGKLAVERHTAQTTANSFNIEIKPFPPSSVSRGDIRFISAAILFA